MATVDVTVNPTSTVTTSDGFVVSSNSLIIGLKSGDSKIIQYASDSICTKKKKKKKKHKTPAVQEKDALAACGTTKPNGLQHSAGTNHRPLTPKSATPLQ